MVRLQAEISVVGCYCHETILQVIVSIYSEMNSQRIYCCTSFLCIRARKIWSWNRFAVFFDWKLSPCCLSGNKVVFIVMADGAKGVSIMRVARSRWWLHRHRILGETRGKARTISLQLAIECRGEGIGIAVTQIGQADRSRSHLSLEADPAIVSKNSNPNAISGGFRITDRCRHARSCRIRERWRRSAHLIPVWNFHLESSARIRRNIQLMSA